SRVTPARHPLDSGGVRNRPPTPTNTFVPVPSHRLPTVLPNKASSAPAARARSRATTFSAYDVVFNPASAPRSLRGHGTVITMAAADHDVGAPHWMTTVASPSPRAVPAGAAAPVTVSRTQPTGGSLALIVASIAARNSSSG